jgi:hypothetical protein
MVFERATSCVGKLYDSRGLELAPMTRHGTVSIGMFYVVHSGLLGLVMLAHKDAQHYIHELANFNSNMLG